MIKALCYRTATGPLPEFQLISLYFYFSFNHLSKGNGGIFSKSPRITLKSFIPQQPQDSTGVLWFCHWMSTMSQMVMLLYGFADILVFKLNNTSSYSFNFSYLHELRFFILIKNTGNCLDLTQKAIYKITVCNGPNDLKNRTSYKKIGNCL